MRPATILPLLLFCHLFFIPLSGSAADTTAVLQVGIKNAPPFSIKNSDGSWSGISVTLWENIAREMGLAFQYHELPLQEILDGLADKRLDVGFSALTITSEREKKIDFTHPFYTTGLGIAVQKENRPGTLTFLRGFFSLNFLKVILSLALLLSAVGILVWFFEKEDNREQFGGGAAKGIGAAFWWAAVTMTTVGYGDKAPKSLAGRIIALFWMFAAIIVISGFTAAITSSLTLSNMQPLIKGPEDLVRVRTGTVSPSTSADYLDENRISHQSFSSVAEGLEALTAGRIDALVYDAPMLRYLVNKEYGDNIEVLKNIFRTQQYGLGLAPASPLREPINHILLETINQPGWRDLLYGYFGG